MATDLDPRGPQVDRAGDKQRLRSANEMEVQKALELYGGASRPSELAGAQMRGDALRQSLGGLGSGNPLAQRAAIYGSGAGSFGAGVEATRMGSADRLRAAGIVDSTGARAGAYTRAEWEAYMQRKAAYEEFQRKEQEAKHMQDMAEQQMTQQLLGSILGTGAAGIAAASGGGGGGGGGGAGAGGQAFGGSSYDQYQQQGKQGGTSGYYWDDPGFEETEGDWWNQYG